MNLSKLSLAELETLICSAMTEYRQRIEGPRFVAEESAPSAPPARAPSEKDQSEIAFLINSLRSGSFAYADEVSFYRRMHREYPQWFKHKGYPSDLRSSPARRDKERNG